MGKKDNYGYVYTREREKENESKNLKKVGILLLISIVLTAFTHFVLVNKKATEESEIPTLKVEKEKVAKEVKEIDDRIKMTEEGKKKTQEIVEKYSK